ncbi:Alpha/Beta hydrolase protein [Podospora aff. communis PSN243]|uniref:sn-1-specific diacylglycerol lipase n=1 Tax=Podospora aff. communis PSN243 TaxID=3040156 RepID=A0AAV9G6N9_9PEZI|nr:Alpha/Beta hydrolase protein [Podospora aff. communis PSN243]
MRWIQRALKRGPVRASAQSVAKSSASLPHCNIASAEASLAASAAVAELTAGLDFVFDRFGDEENPGDQLQYHLERLSEEAEKYPASSLHEGVGKEWPWSPGMSELLKATCQCAAMVYDQTQELGPKGFDIEPVLHRTPSSMGTVKASSMWKIPFTPIPGWNGKTLIVSIKGTSTITDHMVNMNGKSKDASKLFTVPGQDTPVQAHAGFLSCAEALVPAITEGILQQLALDTKISNIVFTGHSAGGAVASLVFLHFAFLANPPPQITSTKLSLITFGSAPSTSPSLTALCRSRPNINLTLSIVNEYDMIARADGPYLRSIIDLYRSRNGLPPLSADASCVPTGPVDGPVKKAWPLPPPEYSLLGDIIVLRLKLMDAPAHNDDETFSQAETLTTPLVKAVEVAPEEFSKLLFCDIGTHRRTAYLERMEMMGAQACGSWVSTGGNSLAAQMAMGDVGGKFSLKC